ncbi:intradiol ring-cleavage dioxygenase [Pseudokineococcus basanitobsidens]|uniref:Intradiol ring-cleavage dioxygenase n=1 Tax=Pseudokineococcus basanitobsidens TaxID=1926649 RepID=A0ABU8RFC5_9ACTN
MTHPTPPPPRRSSEGGTRPPLLRRLRRPPLAPAVPTFEGRPLPRPAEDVEDQGLAFDVQTLLQRRQVLRGLGLGAVGLGLAACGTTAASTGSGTTSSSSAGGSSGEIPDETAGPYPGDGSNGPDVLEQSGVVRSDLTSSFGGATGTAAGVPMELSLTVTDIAGGGVPFAGAAVYVWHCDAQGRYSLYSDGVTEQNYLRGVQVADDEGVVRFTSIVPACYAGRWPHVHLEVYPDVDSITDVGNAVATSQVALPQDLCDAVYATTGYEGSAANLAQVSLTSDGVFGDDGGASQLATTSGDVGSGYAVSLAVGVDTTTEPTGGGMAGGSDGPAGGRGGPPPGAPS